MQLDPTRTSSAVVLTPTIAPIMLQPIKNKLSFDVNIVLYVVLVATPPSDSRDSKGSFVLTVRSDDRSLVPIGCLRPGSIEKTPPTQFEHAASSR